MWDTDTFDGARNCENVLKEKEVKMFIEDNLL